MTDEQRRWDDPRTCWDMPEDCPYEPDDAWARGYNDAIAAFKACEHDQPVYVSQDDMRAWGRWIEGGGEANHAD